MEVFAFPSAKGDLADLIGDGPKDHGAYGIAVPGLVLYLVGRPPETVVFTTHLLSLFVGVLVPATAGRTFTGVGGLAPGNRFCV